VDLDSAVIRLEDEQTKSGEGRTIPLADDVVRLLEAVEDRKGQVFSAKNLRKAWCAACAAVGLGTPRRTGRKQK
jgi:hypothetical protein